MEVHIPSVSGFDIKSNPSSFSNYSLNEMGISPSDLTSHDDFPSSDKPRTPTPDGSESESPAAQNEVADKCGSSETGFPLEGNGDESLKIDVESTLVVGPTEESSESDPGSACQNSDAAVKVQKVYRSYRTRRRLADSAVVAEELWWQLLDYARLNHSTISFFNFAKNETLAAKWIRISKNASKVGKGLSKDDKAQELAFQHWIEAIDPRHRYGHNLHFYYDSWCKEESGQPFFFWLNIGGGKNLDLTECPRSKLNRQCIMYLGPQERKQYEYIVVEGKIIHNQTGCLLNTIEGSQEAKWIFVLSTSKKLYAGEKKKGKFHHSSFLAGGATLASGRLVADHGILKSISRYSGHYKPTDDSLDIFLSMLKENGVNLSEVQIYKANEDSDSYDDTKLNRSGTAVEGLRNLETNNLKPRDEEEKTPSVESTESPRTKTKNDYQRTLSGGLQSPRAEVPQKAILQRINSKKLAKSYQLGHQLSLKWSTGAGPRIGCVADYPVELRLQALEFVNLSPRNPPTPTSYRRYADLASPSTHHASDVSNGDGTSGE